MYCSGYPLERLKNGEFNIKKTNKNSLKNY